MPNAAKKIELSDREDAIVASILSEVDETSGLSFENVIGKASIAERKIRISFPDLYKKATPIEWNYYLRDRIEATSFGESFRPEIERDPFLYVRTNSVENAMKFFGVPANWPTIAISDPDANGVAVYAVLAFSWFSEERAYRDEIHRKAVAKKNAK